MWCSWYVRYVGRELQDGSQMARRTRQEFPPKIGREEFNHPHFLPKRVFILEDCRKGTTGNVVTSDGVRRLSSSTCSRWWSILNQTKFMCELHSVLLKITRFMSEKKKEWDKKMQKDSTRTAWSPNQTSWWDSSEIHTRQNIGRWSHTCVIHDTHVMF